MHCDNAKELFSAPFISFQANKGVICRSSYPYTLQQNGITERKQHHIIETTHTLLISANAPSKFWVYAVLTADFLINRMPYSFIQDKVPHSVLFPNEPLFRTPPRDFGSNYFVHNLNPGLDTLYARAMKCVFLGYS